METEVIPGTCSQAGLQLVEVALRSGRGVAVVAQGGVEREDLLVAEAGIGVYGMERRSYQQAGEDEEHAARSDLGTDYDLVPEWAFFFSPDELERGQDAEEERGEQAHDGGEGKDAPVG